MTGGVGGVSAGGVLPFECFRHFGGGFGDWMGTLAEGGVCYTADIPAIEAITELKRERVTNFAVRFPKLNQSIFVAKDYIDARGFPKLTYGDEVFGESRNASDVAKENDLLTFVVI